MDARSRSFGALDRSPMQIPNLYAITNTIYGGTNVRLNGIQGTTLYEYTTLCRMFTVHVQFRAVPCQGVLLRHNPT